MEIGPEAADDRGVAQELPRDCWSLLVEREAERDVIVAALAGARDGHGRFVILYGQGGIGRSALLRAATTAAATSGTAVLEACGSELERGYEFGVVRQLLERRLASLASDERTALLRHAGPSAEAALGIGPPESRAAGGVFEQIEAVYRLVVRLAGQGPLLLAIDDLQWCDRLSLDLLCFLGNRVRQLPLTVIVGWRRGEPGVKAGRLQALAAMPETSFLTPAPLGRDGVRVMLERALAREPSDEAVVVVESQTRGQPFLVAELAADLRARGVSTDAGCRRAVEALTPERVRRAIAARLGRHSDGVQRFACAAALLVDSPVPYAAAVAEIDRNEARRATDALVRAGILRDESAAAYLQPIVRQAVYDTLSSLERAELHQRAATIICDLATDLEGEDAERAALHLLRCEPAADARFARVLCVAALRAADRGALDAARRLYDRALAELEDDEDRVEVLVRLAEVELRSDHVQAGVRHASEAHARAVALPQRVAAVLLYAQALADGGAWQLAVTLLDVEASGVGPHQRDLELGVRALAATLRACAGEDPTAVAAVAEPAGETTAERELLAARAWQLTLTGGPARRVEELCVRALAADAAPAARYLACQAALLADAGELVERELRRHPHESAPCGIALRAQLALSRGALVDAAELAQAGLGALASRPPTALGRRVRADLLVVVAAAESERDDQDAAAAALADLAQLDARSRSAELSLRLAHAQERAETIPLPADDELAEAVVLGGCPRAWTALALDAAGDRASAQTMATAHLEFAREWGGSSVLGRALAVRGAVDSGAERIRFLEEAVAVLDGGPAELELARATVELGAAHRRAGSLRAARAALTRGADIAHRCGAGALAARARAELVATGARPRRAAFSGVGSLTNAERRVAVLAAAGRTNREIAKELTVSVKTVSGQLTSIYLKLAVHDRVALAAAMQAVDAEGAGLERVR